MTQLCDQLIAITDTLATQVNRLRFAAPVTYVYNPLMYARDPHVNYIKKYAQKGATIWVGMNPGPFGMAQTGVPFGDVSMVRDFLEITGKLASLPAQHPKRPIDGFDCPRSEVSGTRLWGYARQQFDSPATFFKKFFVVNYCPLVFMGETGKNITPDKLPASERDALFAVCDAALAQMAEVIQPRFVLGIGAFAKGACERALVALDVKVGQILHPSPASPAANRGWAEAAHKQLTALKLI
ncbi:MAG: single-stranded DNA-binding protein [Deltaproteobacteria bacterium]|nr:single-stranded DNA-binding protein [Deltaproteobacteria bacterium]